MDMHALATHAYIQTPSATLQHAHPQKESSGLEQSAIAQATVNITATIYSLTFLLNPSD
ncbi:MAG: hypothetical protein AB4050_17615 [Synechococcus sp.]